MPAKFAGVVAPLLLLVLSGVVGAAPSRSRDVPPEAGPASAETSLDLAAGGEARTEAAGGAAHWALILNGDGGPHHVRNCLDAYSALRANGFTDESIFLLSSEPGSRKDSAVLLGPRDGAPTPRNLAAVFRYLREELRPSDTFVLYVTGHGGVSTRSRRPSPFIELVTRRANEAPAKGPKLELRALAAYLRPLRPRRGLLLFDQCYGQAFVRSLGHAPYLGIALSAKAEEVYCQNFSPVFWRELRRAGTERQRTSGASLQGAFDRAYEESQRRDASSTPILRGGPKASEFFLWEP